MIKFLIVPMTSFFIGLAIIAGLVWNKSQDVSTMLKALLTVFLLCVLEISISFDNAVVNATVLKNMNAVWRHRFLTWGMAIAVFGMRFFFPLLIVSITAGVSLYESLQMALTRPEDYSKMMLDSHLAVVAFGGTFLFMVFIHFFTNQEKDSHWIALIEKPLQKVSMFNGVEFVITLLGLLMIYRALPEAEGKTFIIAGLWGVVVFLLVHGLNDLLGRPEITSLKWMSSGAGLFLYLEVLDASFSFDGVIGAFALTTDLIVIMIGLSVGAFFVRGITLYLVEKETLKQYAFLEHGAFYALGALSMFMLLDPFFHFSEWVTALTGAFILLASILWSIYIDRKERAQKN